MDMTNISPQSAQEEIERQQYFLKGAIDRIEGEKAIILLDDGQEISWQKEKLPGDASEGSRVRILIMTSESDQKERERLAKAILNEILNTQKRD